MINLLTKWMFMIAYLITLAVVWFVFDTELSNDVMQGAFNGVVLMALGMIYSGQMK
ncbi:MAG: hypothetical protein KAS66_05220 [Candidatus Omnitrophica bacterium]|nr:hypothetical protein [Candidatus Omnitrophota bacterium]